jgi:hypothetical protein
MKIRNYEIRLIFLLVLFFIHFNFSNLENLYALSSHLPIFITGQGQIKALYIKPVEDKFKGYGFNTENFPKHLAPYVLSRLEWNIKPQMQKLIKDSLTPLELKARAEQSRGYLKVPSSMFLIAVPFDLDFKLKYKGIKKTKEERLPPALNYSAKEGEIVEGFEAGETLLGYFTLNPRWKVISRLSIFEKWEAERLEYVEAHRVEYIPQQELFARKFTGTVKCALGCIWDIEMQHERKVNIEFLMQQTAKSEWKIQQFLLSERKPSGVLFDHWVLTFTYDF